jgi:hypothetical protein
MKCACGIVDDAVSGIWGTVEAFVKSKRGAQRLSEADVEKIFDDVEKRWAIAREVGLFSGEDRNAIDIGVRVRKEMECTHSPVAAGESGEPVNRDVMR